MANYDHQRALADMKSCGANAYVNFRCEPDEYTSSVEDAFDYELGRFSNREQAQMTDAQASELHAAYVGAWDDAQRRMQQPVAETTNAEYITD